MNEGNDSTSDGLVGTGEGRKFFPTCQVLTAHQRTLVSLEQDWMSPLPSSVRVIPLFNISIHRTKQIPHQPLLLARLGPLQTIALTVDGIP